MEDHRYARVYKALKIITWHEIGNFWDDNFYEVPRMQLFLLIDAVDWTLPQTNTLTLFKDVSPTKSTKFHNFYMILNSSQSLKNLKEIVKTFSVSVSSIGKRIISCPFVNL